MLGASLGDDSLHAPAYEDRRARFASAFTIITFFHHHRILKRRIHGTFLGAYGLRLPPFSDARLMRLRFSLSFRRQSIPRRWRIRYAPRGRAMTARRGSSFTISPAAGRLATSMAPSAAKLPPGRAQYHHRAAIKYYGQISHMLCRYTDAIYYYHYSPRNRHVKISLTTIYRAYYWPRSSCRFHGRQRLQGNIAHARDETSTRAAAIEHTPRHDFAYSAQHTPPRRISHIQANYWPRLNTGHAN